jgi:AraC-like DNA-binding protein
MNLVSDQREPDSPFVQAIWRSKSEGGGSFTSVAVSHWEMVVTRQEGHTTFTVRGPETIATPAPIPENADFMGIVFKLGTFMPHLPTVNLVDGAVNLPESSGQSFWLNGAAWEIPNFENADTFVARLVREGLLVEEPVVADVLQNRPLDLSLRSVQRRFLHATGLTRGTLEQIERARDAFTFLEQGLSIADAVYQVGYADQPHLTRSLKRFIGQTPARIIRENEPE